LGEGSVPGRKIKIIKMREKDQCGKEKKRGLLSKGNYREKKRRPLKWKGGLAGGNGNEFRR